MLILYKYKKNFIMLSKTILNSILFLFFLLNVTFLTLKNSYVSYLCLNKYKTMDIIFKHGLGMFQAL
jgi:hypothetical protein